MNLHMDVRSLKWPGYLTFGKSAPQTPKPSSEVEKQPPGGSQFALEVGAGQNQDSDGNTEVSTVTDGEHPRLDSVQVDSESLLEAMTTESLRPPSTRAASPVPQTPPSNTDTPGLTDDPNTDSHSTVAAEDISGDVSDENSAYDKSVPSVSTVDEQKLPAPIFLKATVFMNEPHDPRETRRMQVLHLTVSSVSHAQRAVW